jgi:hypothetical protein
MLLVFSHVLAFCVLFIDSLFDLFNNNDIPDEFAVTGIIVGIVLHAAYSYFSGSPEAIIWSLGAGAVFSVYGWAAYWKGMWGGADAMLLSMIGFAIPTGVAASGQLLNPLVHVLDLVFNFMISAVFVMILTSSAYFYRSENGFSDILSKLAERKKIISAELVFSMVFAFFLMSQGMNGAAFFALIFSLLLLFEVLRIIEKDFFVREIAVEDLEGGEVPVSGQGLGERVKGLKEEDIEEIEQKSIEVREGIPMVPAFLLGLLITELTGIGVWIVFAFH